MLLRKRVPGDETTGGYGQTGGLMSPNVRRLIGIFIVVCLASAAGIPRQPPPQSDAEKVPLRVDGAEPWRQIGQDGEAEDNDLLLPRQHKTGNSFQADGEQDAYSQREQRFLPEGDARAGDGNQDRSADAVAAYDGLDEATNSEDDPSLRVAPKYMLELYRKFSNDKYSHPIANIVRSFLNINTGALPSLTTGNGTRIALHTLLFNISSVNREEEIYLAELRIYAAEKTQRVLVYEVVHQTSADPSSDPSAEAAPDTADDLGPTSRHYQLLTTRDIPRGHGDWETFAVTEVVRRWVRTQASAGHILEVRVDTARPETVGGGDEAAGGTAGEKKDEGVDEEGGVQNGAFEPILVVFSNDRKRRKIELRELHEIQSHEDRMGADEDPSSPSSSSDFLSSSTSSVLSGTEEEDEDYEEEEDDDDDRDGTRLNSTVSGGGREDDLDGEKRYRESLTSTPSAWKKPQHARVKRSVSRNRRRRAKRNSCRRKPMWVDFGDVQWNRWIIEPPGYQAYECTGQCYFPVSERLTPTKYAMIKSLLHATYPKKVAAVCCVPTRLEPISLLYIDEHGTVTYKYKYDGMVVAECGCR